jgi:hypothetical protein
MKTMSKLAIVMTAMVWLAGCAGGGGMVDDQKAQQRRDSEKLQAQYDSVRGTYEGTISNPATGLRPTPARLSLYIQYVQDGVNTDGTPKVRPTLRGRFRLIDAVSETDMLTLIGDFDGVSGEMTLTTASGTQAAGAAASGDANMLELRGGAAAGATTLTVTRRGGVWGTFNGTRTSTEASAPAAGEEAEQRERILAVYNKIAGTYTGVVNARGGERYEVEITLIIVERSGTTLPGLAGQYRRTDFMTGIGEKILSVEYNSLTGEIFMRDAGGSKPGAPEGGNLFSISGTVINKVMKVELSDRRGKIGAFVASAP